MNGTTKGKVSVLEVTPIISLPSLYNRFDLEFGIV
jgi:hypothetical protein